MTPAWSERPDLDLHRFGFLARSHREPVLSSQAGTAVIVQSGFGLTVTGVLSLHMQPLASVIEMSSVTGPRPFTV